jgi:hypothetical protein
MFGHTRQGERGADTCATNAAVHVLAAEAGFLPRFAFPFVKLFGAKAESAFEAVATLLLNWCSGWFELFPNPPLPLLRRFLVSLCLAEGCSALMILVD